MTKEVQKKLFNLFFTTKCVGHGTGLGLSISYQIVVEKHLGKLQCISAPGQGTEFLISLPIKQQKSEEQSKEFLTKIAGKKTHFLHPQLSHEVI